jgi:hypothetical protein
MGARPGLGFDQSATSTSSGPKGVGPGGKRAKVVAQLVLDFIVLRQ